MLIEIVKGEATKSNYINKIAGYFTFVAFSGLSIVAWILNWVCWKKKFFCCKLYHNPIITRIFWWLSFSFLCGIIACCISGLIFGTRFGKYIRVVQCTYERIYYDSEYGELKDSYPKWEGLKNNALKLNVSKNLLEHLDAIDSNCFLNEDDWKSDFKLDDFNITFNGKNPISYIEAIEDLLKECNKFNGNIFDKDHQLFFNIQKPDDINSILGKYIFKENKLMNNIYEKFESIKESISDLKDFSIYAYGQINDSVNNFEEISKDLDNYKNSYLNNVEYYVKVGKGCGYILVMIYFSLLSLISICGCFLLLAYTYLSNQGNLEKLMHIIWNSIRFFSFSFLMYGAAFGMLYKGLRDLISYNKFLFGKNLEVEFTYVLPKGKAKYFLNICLNEEKTEYNGEIDPLISNDLDKFFSNLEEIDNLLKEQNSLGGYFQYNNYNFYVSPILLLRNINEDTSDSTEELSNETELNTIINYYLDSTQKERTKVINQVNNSFSMLIEKINLNDDYKLNKISLSNSNSNLYSYNCGFLKSDLNLLYNSLYDLSVESRILFILSCCIGFFGEALIYFYLLAMYHYNNTEFKEGNLDLNKSRNRTRNNIDEGSRNEFMDKNKPANMRKFNKYLDKDFNKDFSTSVRKGLK